MENSNRKQKKDTRNQRHRWYHQKAKETQAEIKDYRFIWDTQPRTLPWKRRDVKVVDVRKLPGKN